MPFCRLIVLAAVALLSWGSAARAQLTAEDLVLVVNKNEPVGRELAEFYAQARSVPDGRIVELDLPTGDQVNRADYQRTVVEPLRAFLTDNGLKERTRCLVTFYGVPLRVGKVVLTDAELAERVTVDEQAALALQAVLPGVERAVATAEAIGGNIPAEIPFGTPLQVAVMRLELAERQIRQLSQQLSDSERASLQKTALAIRELLTNPHNPTLDPLSSEEREQFKDAVANQSDPEARGTARALAPRAPALDYARIIALQQKLLEADQTVASLDSEIAALWQDNAPTTLWTSNPLGGNLDFSRPGPRPLMTCRLDGPDPQSVRDIIAESLLTEQEGLTGKIVIDSRGIRGKNDGYEQFDEQLRRLVMFLERSATLEIVHDDRPELLQRTDDGPAVDDVAVYVGWYQLRDYEPAFDFARGAVGFHVASLELVNLHNENERGWVRGLLKDGVTATMGAVSEPYLSAFPPPTGFVPLLLEGRLTLAEVYWATMPHVSWQMSLIGDPLYRPFAAKPGINASELPPQFGQLRARG